MPKKTTKKVVKSPIKKSPLKEDKICASRKTKDFPNVYTLLELKRLAISQGHDRKAIRPIKDKKELCNILNIEWNELTGKVKSKSVKKLSKKKTSDKSPETLELEMYQGRSCSQNPSKNNPNAFTKTELIDLAVKHMKSMKKTEISKMKKTEICALLEKHKVKLTPSETKSPKKSSKKSSTPKSRKKSPKKSSKKSPTPKKRVQPKGDCIERSKMKLRHHQIEVVEYLKKNRGVVAAFDVGTGKTLTAVAASQCFLDSHSKGRVFVVTPKSLQENFKKELKAYGVEDDDRYKFFTIRKFTNTYANSSFPNDIFLIIDEAHNLRTGGSANAEAAKKAEKVLLLTATPLYNSPHDLLSLAAIIKGTDILSKKKFDQMSDKEMCHYFEGMFMFFDNPRTSDFPDIHEHDIKIIMSNKYYNEYRKVEKKNSHLWQDKNPWTFLTGVRQATNALEGCQKCEWTIDKILEGEKTLVYSAFLTHGVEKLQKMLDELGISYVQVTGKMSMDARNEAVKKYNSGKVKVIFVTKAGGEGLDLKGTMNIILLEKSWNRPNEKQLIGRGGRYKSHASPVAKDKRYVNVYHLLIIKPSEAMRDYGDNKESADVMLHDITKRKEEANTKFEALLRSVAINAPSGKCPPKGFEYLRTGYEGKFEVKVVDLRPYKMRVKKKGAQKVITDTIHKKYAMSDVAFEVTKERTTIAFEVTKRKDADMFSKRVARVFIGSDAKDFEGVWKDDTHYVYTIRYR